MWSPKTREITRDKCPSGVLLRPVRACGQSTNWDEPVALRYDRVRCSRSTEPRRVSEADMPAREVRDADGWEAACPVSKHSWQEPTSAIRWSGPKASGSSRVSQWPQPTVGGAYCRRTCQMRCGYQKVTTCGLVAAGHIGCVGVVFGGRSSGGSAPPGKAGRIA